MRRSPPIIIFLVDKVYSLFAVCVLNDVVHQVDVVVGRGHVQCGQSVRAFALQQVRAILDQQLDQSQVALATLRTSGQQRRPPVLVLIVVDYLPYERQLAKARHALKIVLERCRVKQGLVLAFTLIQKLLSVEFRCRFEKLVILSFLELRNQLAALVAAAHSLERRFDRVCELREAFHDDLCDY